MSLAGAQHKLLAVYQDDKLYEPEGATLSTHILKPDRPDIGSWPASVVNEFVTMRIAAAARLPVPAVHIRYVPDPVYVVERFDRRVAVLEPVEKDIPKLVVQRLHIIERTTNKLHSRLQLFRWLVFNVVMANDDCHLKNLSFLHRGGRRHQAGAAL